MSMICTDLVVNRQNFSDAHYIESELPSTADLPAGQVILKIDSFAFTANNITYAVAGEFLNYWQFFPTADKNWGRIPVWGFADVIASTVDEILVGERVYGYLPMSTYLVITPGQISGRAFIDVAPHRQKLSPIYNQYTRIAADPSYKKEHEGVISLFRPLFTTSFLLDDYEANHDFFGADTVILSSASSKTALGTAFLLGLRRPRVSVVGLTSPRNISFVESVGFYDTVLAYEELESLPVAPSAFIDMAGNLDVTSRLHHHLADALQDSSRVGMTHWQAFGRSDAPLPGPKPEMFFAPSHAQARLQEWGPAQFQSRIAAVWADFVPNSESWISVKESRGQEGVMAVYQATLGNRADPAVGHIVSLWD